MFIIMGFLSLFQSKEKKEENEDSLYRTLLLKNLMSDVEQLKLKCHSLEKELNLLKFDNLKTSNSVNDNIKTKLRLTNKETKLFNIYSQNFPLTLTELSKLSNTPENTLKVYLSRIRTKGYKIELTYK